MVAALLFIVGLVSVVVAVVLVGFSAPALIAEISGAFSGPTSDLLPTATRIAASLSWTVTPVVGGLVLMGLARVIMLLGAINRSLRGAA